MTAKGGPATLVKQITAADLVENGGTYKLTGRKYLRVNKVTRTGVGGMPIAVYEVPDADLDQFAPDGDVAVLPVVDSSDIGISVPTQGLIAVPVQGLSTPPTPFAGAYDAFEADLAHVYEPARRTLTSYTGSLVRLRRDSDDAESDFGYDAVGDLDTAAISTWLGGANGYVVTVYDQVGGDDVTQATAAEQPLYVASGQNGKPVMRGDGSGHNLKVTFSTISNRTLYSVVKFDGAAFDYAFDGDANTRESSLTINSTPAYVIDAGSPQAGGTASTSYILATFKVDTSGNDLLRVNSASVISGVDAGSDTINGITLMARNDGNAALDGDLGSLLVCNTLHSAENISVAEAAINDYWSIY